MRKNFWKEGCLLLIGIWMGTLYEKHVNHSFPIIKKEIDSLTIIKRDTIIAKATVPTEKSVLAELQKQKVPHAKIVLAQTKLESNNYKSKLTKTHNNILGLRKGNKYRKYSNYKECIQDYKRLISSKYKGGDYYQFLSNIGYAEDPNYIVKLKNLV